jgi:hypothetical protein
MCKFLVSHCTYNLYFWNSYYLLLIAMFLQILPKITKKNRNKTSNITQTKITGIFTTLLTSDIMAFLVTDITYLKKHAIKNQKSLTYVC